MNGAAVPSTWRDVVALIARLVFAALFTMAFVFKFKDIDGTAAYIAAAGFPISTLLAWVAAFFELALMLCFLTGAFFTEASLLAAIYVVFLAFSFHNPSGWENASEEMKPLLFGAFVDHFTFCAGLLFAAIHGPGRFALRHKFIGR